MLLRGLFCEVVCDVPCGFPANLLAHVVEPVAVDQFKRKRKIVSTLNFCTWNCTCRPIIIKKKGIINSTLNCCTSIHMQKYEFQLTFALNFSRCELLVLQRSLVVYRLGSHMINRWLIDVLLAGGGWGLGRGRWLHLLWYTVLLQLTTSVSRVCQEREKNERNQWN